MLSIKSRFLIYVFYLETQQPLNAVQKKEEKKEKLSSKGIHGNFLAKAYTINALFPFCVEMSDFTYIFLAVAVNFTLKCVSPWTTQRKNLFMSQIAVVICITIWSWNFILYSFQRYTSTAIMYILLFCVGIDGHSSFKLAILAIKTVKQYNL